MVKDAPNMDARIMRSCEHVHQEYDTKSNGKVEVGILPPWMRVNGRVAWYVFQGPYKRLPDGWNEFWKKFGQNSTLKVGGPPGDVYVCMPREHEGNEDSMITIFWAPLKE